MGNLYRIFLSLVLISPVVGCGIITPAPSPPNVTIEELLAYEESAAGLSTEEVATLRSLEIVDDYPLYTMRFYGAYEVEPSSVKAGLPQQKQQWGCSLFAAFGDANNMLYGRNLDWRYSPAMLLFTDPPDGYASVTMVDLEYLGFGPGEERNLTSMPLAERRPLLLAPFLPFDGMNEHGLVVGMAAVPESKLPHDPRLKTTGSLRVIREMLDHARNVKEAVALLHNNNIDFIGGPQLHYLIADSSGSAVLVEFYQGKLIIIPAETGWHIATNFLLSGADEFSSEKSSRYKKMSKRLRKTNGQIGKEDALRLLSKVAQTKTPTQWSIVYQMSTGDISVVMGRSYDTVHAFHLDFATE